MFTPGRCKCKNKDMPGRKTVFANDYFYHVYNRGSEKRDIFTKHGDFQRFIKTIYYYQYEGPKPRLSLLNTNQFINFKPDNNKKLVEIICYCLMPNHYHFLLKQVKDQGISKFISQLSNSYTKYFNTRYNRVGALFQGAFQAVLIESEEQLIHVSRYIHLNPAVSLIVKNPGDYNWSSFNEFKTGMGSFCFKEPVLSLFPSREAYDKFVLDQADYGRTLEILKHTKIPNYDYT